MLQRIEQVLATRSPKRDLFQYIERFIAPSDPEYREIEKAYEESREACKNRRRADGSPAIGHGRAVALILVACLGVKDPAKIKAALAHDVVEDIKGWTHEDIEKIFGSDVAYYVRWVSKDPRKNFPSKEVRDRVYSETFLLAPRDVLLIKLSDVLHNLCTLFACSTRKQKRIVGVARRIYLPLAEKHDVLHKEILAAIIRVEEGWSSAGDKKISQRSQFARSKAKRK